MTSKAVIEGLGDCISVEYWTGSDISAYFQVEGLYIRPIDKWCVKISLADKGETVGWLLVDEYEVDFRHIDLQEIRNENPGLKPTLCLTTRRDSQ